MIDNKLILDRIFEMSAMSHTGGMMGWVDATTKKHEYLYGEITGYYLSLLAYIYSHGNDIDKGLLTAEMRKQITWLLNELNADNGLITRKYYETTDDWKNNAVFLFDVTMILRGINSVSNVCAIDVAPEALVQYKNLLERFKKEESLEPFLLVKSGVMPVKWATRVDIHYLKIIAALTEIGGYEKVVAHYIDYFSNNISRQHLMDTPTHPLMYYFEGWLALKNKKLTSVKFDQLNFNQFMEFLDENHNKTLTNRWSGDGEIRSDIVAQVIRIAAILFHCSMMSEADYIKYVNPLLSQLEKFYLLGYICFFRNTSEINHFNAWSAMFSYQALDFVQLLNNGIPLDERINHLV